MKILKCFSLLLGVLVLNACYHKTVIQEEAVKAQFANAEVQLSMQLEKADKANRIPKTISENGEMKWTNVNFGWTEGFFPGSCWYLYQATGNEKWKRAAEKFQSFFEEHKYKTSSHDLGFIFNCSYGNGYRLTGNKDFKEVLITAADSLITRFDPVVGCIKSWNPDRGWQAERGWMFPVIIDNMMNLELLFEVSRLTANPRYREIAISHANVTLKNHFRDDNSSYHVVDYNSITGKVRKKETAQGYSHQSAWARGQAWGLYGYTLCYRYTRDRAYLEQAQKIAEFMIHHENMPDDGIPYWDFNAPGIPNEPRDVSASTIMLSALIELDGYASISYRKTIDKMMRSLASPSYTAKQGENQNFILKHSVGSIPHGAEIDKPLTYADYYYLEAMTRYIGSYSGAGSKRPDTTLFMKLNGVRKP